MTHFTQAGDSILPKALFDTSNNSAQSIPPPSPSNPLNVQVVLVEDDPVLGRWFAVVYVDNAGGGVVQEHFGWIETLHPERAHTSETGFEIWGDDPVTTIHKTWLMGVDTTTDYWKGGTWTLWPDYAQIEQNSPPPKMVGIDAPNFFCGEKNSPYHCPAGSGSVPPPFPPVCPTATPTPTPTITPTPTVTATPTITPTTLPPCPPHIEPIICSLCRNCLVCCAACAGGDCDACELMALWWPDPPEGCIGCDPPSPCFTLSSEP